MSAARTSSTRCAAGAGVRAGAGRAEHWRASRRWHARTGLTLLEVVLATALLGMVAASVLGALASIWGWQSRQQQMLGAAELANRLMLTYLDDRTAMPSASLPLAYGPYRYRWEIEKMGIKVKDPDDLSPEAAQKRADRTARAGLDRIEHIRVRVWLSEESPGGTAQAEEQTPQVLIERLADPVAFRNPDSIKKMFGNPDKMGATIGDMFTQRQTGGSQKPAAGDGGKDATKSGGGR